jgi:proline dehydrogenase
MSIRLSWARFGHRPLLARTFSSAPRRPRSVRLPALGLASGVSVASYLWLNSQPSLFADAEKPGHDRPPPPLSHSLRAWLVYAMCSVPALVDSSPALLAALLAIPGVRDVAKAFVRVTFFEQFVGAETAEGAIPVVQALRAENKGCLFAYSVEVDENEAAGKAAAKGKHAEPAYKQSVREMIHSIDVAADFEDKLLPSGTSKGRRTWVAVKLVRVLFPWITLVIDIGDRLRCCRTISPSLTCPNISSSTGHPPP